MQSIEIKFRKSSLHIMFGWLWFTVALINLMLLGFFCIVKPAFTFWGIVCILELLITASLSLVIFKYYVCLHRRIYFKIYEKEIIIHRGLLWRAYIILLGEIDFISLKKKKLYFVMKNRTKARYIKFSLVDEANLDIIMNSLLQKGYKIKSF